MNRIIVFLLILFPVLLLSPVVCADDFGAVYNSIDWVCEIDGVKASILEQEEITVTQKSGREHVRLSFIETEYIKLNKIKISVFDSDGKQVNSLDKKDLARACGFGQSFQLYNDICYYFKEIAYPSYPFVVKIYVEKEIESLFFWRGLRFQRSVPVEHFSYRLICPKDFKFAHKVYGSEYNLEIDSASAKYYYSWVIDSIPPFEKIDYLPDSYLNDGQLMFVADRFRLGKYEFEGSGWNSVASFYADLSRECYLTPDLSIQPRSGLKDALREAYDDIITSNRYVSVSIDIGGWQPHDAGYTGERGYGDCKDLSTLLISRLSKFDIDLFPCLALTRGDGETDTAFPNYAFNHVFVLAVKGSDSLWMDPTCDKCPIGEIPPSDENINVLVVGDNGGVLRKTKASLPEDNQVLKSGRIAISSDGYIEMDIVNTYRGHSARVYRHRIEESTVEEFRNYFINILPGSDKTYEIEELSIYNADDIYKPLVIECRVTRKKPIDIFRDVYYIPTDIFDNLIPNASLNLEDREIAIRKNYPVLYKYDLEFSWDSTIAVDSVAFPSDTALEYPFGAFNCSYQFSGNTVMASLIRKSFEYQVDSEDLGAYTEYRNACREISRKYIKLFCRN